VKEVMKVVSNAVHEQVAELEENVGIDFDSFKYEMKSVTQ